MMPSGPPTPMVGSHQVPSSLLSNSGHLGAAGSGGGAQPRTQFNVSSFLSHSFGNADPDSASFAGANHNPNQQQPPVKPAQSFQQQFSVPQGGMGNVKMEAQVGPAGDGSGPAPQLQSLRGQQLQALRGFGPVKMEPQNSDPSSLFLQQQQQQQFLQMPRQSSQAALTQMNLVQLQQQRILLQQQQQKQQQQQRLQLQQQNLPLRPQQAKPNQYEPGMCARRLTHYMYHQQHRPEDNNIGFWRKFVAEYFAPNARKRWCVSQYGSGRQTTGVFPQDVWHCEICNRKPGRGFETTIEVLPRLLQIKYASGTLEELLYVDMPREYQNASGQIVLDYAKAIQESVFDQLRVVRDGRLRIVFNSDLKISSWEFCARRHEELIPRRLLIPQVSQLGAVVHKYQTAAPNASSLSAQDLQTSCNSFVSSTRQLAKALEVPLVNDLGYTKRYVRCLQISEVVNSMKDLIDYSRETGTGPMDSLINFPRVTPSGIRLQQPKEQQSATQISNHNDDNSLRNTSAQLATISNGIASVNDSVNAPSSATTSAVTISGLLHQNSMNSRQESHYAVGSTVQIPSASSSSAILPSQPNPPTAFQSPTPSSSNNNPTSTSHSPHLNAASSPANISAMQQQAAQSHEADQSNSQSSVQQILQEMIMSSQLNVASTSFGNEIKAVNGTTPILNGMNCLTGNRIANRSGIGGLGFGGMGGINPRATASGIRTALANNAMNMNGRVGMNHILQDPTLMSYQQQQGMGSRISSGLGAVNSFNNLPFDWKSSP